MKSSHPNPTYECQDSKSALQDHEWGMQPHVNAINTLELLKSRCSSLRSLQIQSTLLLLYTLTKTLNQPGKSLLQGFHWKVLEGKTCTGTCFKWHPCKLQIVSPTSFHSGKPQKLIEYNYSWMIQIQLSNTIV